MSEQTLDRPTTVPTAAAPAVAVRRRAPKPDKIALYIVLAVLALFFVLPLVWMLSSSLKEGAAVYTDQGWIPENPTLANFQEIFGSSFPVLRWLSTSLVTSVIGTVLVLILTSMSGYAFARMDFPGKKFLFTILIATLLLPAIMFLVPQFLVLLKVGTVIPALSTAAQPSAGEVSALVATIKRTGVKTIFPESSVNPKVEAAVAREAGARIGPELWADSLGPEGSDGATYIGSIAANTRALADGFSGGAVDCRLDA